MAEPTKLGKYQIIEEIGRGGFATVYRARDTKLNRDVALKIFSPVLTRDDSWAQKFVQEAHTIARLNHPRIVTIYEVDEIDGRLFIAMELVDGPNLAFYLRQNGKPAWDETVRLMEQIAEALDAAHAQGIAHRDLKPANVLLHPQRGAILTDFGFAKLVGENSYSMSMSSGLVGTPNYMAPEVCDERNPDTPADIYALGCILYEIVTGEQLFTGDTISGIMRTHFQGLALPEQWPADTPDTINQTLTCTLALDPAARYPSAHTFISTLQSTKIESKPVTDESLITNDKLTQNKEEPQPPHRRPYIQWVIGGIILLLF